jgi:hypothetical protein
VPVMKAVTSAKLQPVIFAIVSIAVFLASISIFQSGVGTLPGEFGS